MMISVLIAREGECFIAHALDFDLMSQGDTPEDALRAVKENIATYIAGCQELGLEGEQMLRQAPKEFYDRFEEVFRKKEAPFFVGTLDLNDFLRGPREEAAAAV